MAFVAVLSWSRQIFLRFYSGAHMENLRYHVGAFPKPGAAVHVLHSTIISKARYWNAKGQLSVSTRRSLRWRGITVLRAASGRDRPRQRERPCGARHPLYPRRLLCRAFLQRCGRSQCPGRRLGERFRRRATLSGNESLTVNETFAQERERLLDLPGNALPTEEVKAVSAGQDTVCAFRSQRLFDSAHVCGAHADGGGHTRSGAHP